MILEAVHPAYVRHFPMRGRAWRDSLVAVRTPVEIPECDPRKIVPAGRAVSHWQPQGAGWRHVHVARGCDLVSFAGRIYRPLGADPGEPGHRRLPVERLASFLSGRDAGAADAEAIGRDFLWTPLVDPLFPDGSFRGKDFDEGRQREVAHDGRAAASAAVSAFVTDAFLTDGRDAYVLHTPFVRPIHHGSGKGEAILHHGRAIDVARCLPTVPAAVEEAARAEGITRLSPLREDAVRVLSLVRDGSRLSDVAACLSAISIAVDARLREAFPDGERSVMANRLGALAMRARSEGLADTELGAAASLLREALDRVGAGDDGPGSARFGRARAYLANEVGVRLSAGEPLMEDDAEAIAGLAP